MKMKNMQNDVAKRFRAPPRRGDPRTRQDGPLFGRMPPQAKHKIINHHKTENITMNFFFTFTLWKIAFSVSINGSINNNKK